MQTPVRPTFQPPAELSWHGTVAVLSLNEPDRRNALSLAMLASIGAALDAASDARVIIVRASPGASVWCAGFDIAALAPGFDPLAEDGPLKAVFRRIADHPGMVIAMLHGSAWGGGTDLALRCDFAIADPTCTLAFTPAKLGLPYDSDGLLNVVGRAGPAAALEMFGAADPMPAARALQLGLLNHVVPEPELEAFTFALADRIAANAPLSVASAKQQIRALSAALPLPSATAQRLAEGRSRALNSSDYAEGLAAFRARRAPVFTGA